MAYPENTYEYFSDPDFPTGYDWFCPGQEAYEVIAAYIEDVAADTILLIDTESRIMLQATKGIKWQNIMRISIASDEIKIEGLQLSDGIIATNADISTLSGVSLSASHDLASSTDVSVSGTISNGGKPAIRVCHELSETSEPDDPADNSAVIWLSNGTGYGDQGDLCAKITEGGGTSSFTIVDFSAA